MRFFTNFGGAFWGSKNLDTLIPLSAPGAAFGYMPQPGVSRAKRPSDERARLLGPLSIQVQVVVVYQVPGDLTQHKRKSPVAGPLSHQHHHLPVFPPPHIRGRKKSIKGAGKLPRASFRPSPKAETSIAFPPWPKRMETWKNVVFLSSLLLALPLSTNGRKGREKEEDGGRPRQQGALIGGGGGSTPNSTARNGRR